MAMTLVSTVTVGSGGAASIEFTNIAQTGKDLLLLFSLRFTSGGGVVGNTQLTINGSGSGYNEMLLGTTTNSPFTISSTSPIRHYANDSGSTASTFSNQSIYFSNYASTSNKSYCAEGVAENNGTNAGLYIIAGSQTSSVGITSVKVEPWSGGGYGNLAQHSTASLYIIS